MGRVSRKYKVDRIYLDDTDWIEIRSAISQEHFRRLVANTVLGVDCKPVNQKLLETFIKRWNLRDKEGKKMQVNRETIFMLTIEVKERILGEINDRFTLKRRGERS